MRSVLFCHDGPLIINSNSEVYGISHTNGAFARYKLISENVKILIRIKKTEDIAGRNRIDTAEYKIIEAPNMAQLKSWLDFRNKINVFRETIKESSYIVVRVPGIQGIICYHIAKKYNKKILLELVGDPYLAYKYHSIKGRIIAPIMKKLYKNMLKNSEWTIYVTSNYLQHKYPSNGFQLACSNVEIEHKDIVLNKHKYAHFDLNQNVIKLGTISPLHIKFKNQEAVIKSLGLLKKKGIENFEYYLVGPGDSTRLKKIAIKENVYDKIHFVGVLNKTQIYKYLDSLDIYIQPSKQEGLPRAIIEAMSRGVVCLGATTAGIPELLEPKYLFSNKKTNYKEIVEILLNLKKENLMQTSELNYYKSFEYEKEKLHKKRNEFFLEFKETLI